MSYVSHLFQFFVQLVEDSKGSKKWHKISQILIVAIIIVEDAEVAEVVVGTLEVIAGVVLSSSISSSSNQTNLKGNQKPANK